MNVVPTTQPWAFALLLALFLVSPEALSTGLARADTPPSKAWTVQVVEGVPYYKGKDADPGRHCLDLYLPEGKKDFPVLMLVHGGAWVMGDKGLFGWGSDIGRYFASQGFGVVMPSYRLSPGVRHPEHVKDVARAFAWTVQHIGCYGGNAGELFLCGHSAGGHLVCLLATNSDYLRDEGLSLSAVKGVISVSGVYRIPAIDLSFGLPGISSGAWRSLTSLFGVAAPKGDKAKPAADLPGSSGKLQIPWNLLASVFGSDLKGCAAASPLTYVRRGLPPFLLINAERDLPLLPQMARDFASALRAANDEVYEQVFKGRNHEDVMFLASSDQDPVARAIVTFIRRHCERPTSK
jgi:acetyl esterase/lipase